MPEFEYVHSFQMIVELIFHMQTLHGNQTQTYPQLLFWADLYEKGKCRATDSVFISKNYMWK